MQTKTKWAGGHLQVYFSCIETHSGAEICHLRLLSHKHPGCINHTDSESLVAAVQRPVKQATTTGWVMVTHRSWGHDGCMLSASGFYWMPTTVSEIRHPRSLKLQSYRGVALWEEVVKNFQCLALLQCISLGPGFIFRRNNKHFPDPTARQWKFCRMRVLWLSTHHCRNGSNSWGQSWRLPAALALGLCSP